MHLFAFFILEELMSLSLVVIPTYKERENIEAIIRKIFSTLSTHILIVDDSSPDGTGEIVQTLMNEYPGSLFLEQRKGKLGLGTAYIHGFRWGLSRSYEYICEMDADFSHDPASLPELIHACEKEGYDLSIGSRYVNGVNVINWPIGRVLMSYYASAYVRMITGMSIRDTTAGFKCYRRKVLETILVKPIKFVGYAFQIEMKFRAWKYGFNIKEVPIIFRDREKGESKIDKRIIKEAFLGVITIKVSSWFQSWKIPNQKINSPD